MSQQSLSKNDAVKEVQIKPEFLYNMNSGKKKTLKSRTKVNTDLKPNNLKKTLLEKIKKHRLNSNSNLESNSKNKDSINVDTSDPKDINKNDLVDKFKASCSFFESLSDKKKNKMENIGGNLIVDTNINPENKIPIASPSLVSDSNQKGDSVINNLDISNNESSETKQPPYSSLKNGSKPTYREWKKTQKNSSDLNQIKCTLGKKGRKVSILVRNSATRKKISKEHLLLKQVKISSMKNYLKKHNLLRAGSYAPSDVIKKMYEQALLTGEVNNSNTNNAVQNYLAE